MKNSKTAAAVAAAFIIMAVSCNEGPWNFNETTGNLSVEFSRSAGVSVDISQLVFNLENEDTGAFLTKTLKVYGDTSRDYVSRIDTGRWNISATLYGSGFPAPVLAENSDSFILELGETARVGYSYWSDGSSSGLVSNWKVSSGGTLVPMLDITRTGTLITLFHQPSMAQPETAAVVVVHGTGFDRYLEGLELEYPDGSIFSAGSMSRGLSGISMEVQPGLITINRQDYTAKGTYSVSLTDPNLARASSENSCMFGPDPETSFGYLTGIPGADMILSLNTEYINSNPHTGSTYILYNVNQSDGLSVSGGFSVIQVTDVTADLSIPTTPPAGYLTVLVTVDIFMDPVMVNNAFGPGTYSALPKDVPGRLYEMFGDTLGYVAVSSVLTP